MTGGPEKWDVVLLTYPFSDLSGTKVRPAIVVSPDELNRKDQDALFVLITSNMGRMSDYEILLDQSHPDFKQSGLLKPNMIRVPKIWNLDQKLIRKTLGSAGPRLRVEIEAALRKFLELPELRST